MGSLFLLIILSLLSGLMMSKEWTRGATFIRNSETLFPPRHRKDEVVFTSVILGSKEVSPLEPHGNFWMTLSFVGM